MNLANALKIQGFTNEHELRWLATQAGTRKLIVEIGAWKGRSTRAMADNTEGTVYAVDTWKGTPADPHFKELENKPEDWLLDQFGANMDPAWFKSPYKVRPWQGTSIGGADYLGNHYGNKFDMIFIDAAHDYEAVIADIDAWLPHLAPGGLFCGHDYAAGRGGVVRAVNHRLPKAKAVGIGTLWSL